ncbi:MAG: dTDP-4-dehydrorhamnose 3,5-epimerase [Oscillospiraceae bacterium]|nr:dTDP-4-dehydrorhamnose 3,5-epimerase [Oscillospiraceae bacterium]
MKKIDTTLKDLYILEPQVFGDNRGWFMETWSKRNLEALGLNYDFVQDNESYSSAKGTLRGIHFQRGNKAQAKIVRCTKGSVLDIAVDLRPSSPTYLKWEAVVLSAQNKLQLLIPRGFGHAYLTLTNDVVFSYKADNFYYPEADGGIRWNDPDIGVVWPVEKPVLSRKDAGAPLFKDIITGFEDW